MQPRLQTACVSLPWPRLQLLRMRHPSWRTQPLAVVSRDSAQGQILAVNRQAFDAGVRRGMRYAAALSLEPALRADTVTSEQLQSLQGHMFKELLTSAPVVQQVPGQDHDFWLGIVGLQELYPDWQQWLEQQRQRLLDCGFVVSLVAGFQPFAVWALARSQVRCMWLPAAAAEQASLHRILLTQIVEDAAWLHTCRRLGVYTLGNLLDLPQAEVRLRLGEQAAEFLSFAMASHQLPLQGVKQGTKLQQGWSEEDADDSRERNLFRLRRLSARIVVRARMRNRAISALHCVVEDGRRSHYKGCVSLAEPGLDELLIFDLIRLWMETQSWQDGILSFHVLADTVELSREQLYLLSRYVRRDMDKLAQSLARIRAAHGDDSVCRVFALNGQLPEARWQFEPIKKIPEPKSITLPDRIPLVRRIFLPSQPLANSVGRSRGGPYLLSGGWWQRWLARAYYYRELRSGDIIWCYYDRVRQRWFQQGRVE